MCGIVGAVAQDNIVPVLLEGLHRLEYRGYDSSGLALLNGKLNRIRTAGRVSEMSRSIKAKLVLLIHVGLHMGSHLSVMLTRIFQAIRRRSQWYTMALLRIMRRYIND